MTIRWIQIGVVGGLIASVLFPTLLFVPMPLSLTAVAAALLGPSIGIGSLGLWQLSRIHRPTVTAALGAFCNVTAGALLTAMLLVQLAVRHLPGNEAAPHSIVGVWLGIDVAWDAYIGLGTLFFASALHTHPRFGWPFSVSAYLIGLALLGLNFYTFPTPPAEAGLVDVGPVVGLWYLTATVQAWRSIPWAREKLNGGAPQ